MSVPLRKDDEFAEEKLTTADLAQGKRSARPTAVDDLLDKTGDEPIGTERIQDRIEDRIENRRDGESLQDEGLRGERPGENRPGPVLAQRPAGEMRSASEVKDASTRNDSDGRNGETQLFPSNELEELRSRWSGVQTAFVDEPRRAVEQADELVAAAMKRLAEVFAEERSKLEHQWDRGDSVSTEDLRIALQRYRSFFQRLLAI